MNFTTQTFQKEDEFFADFKYVCHLKFRKITSELYKLQPISLLGMLSVRLHII